MAVDTVDRCSEQFAERSPLAARPDGLGGLAFLAQRPGRVMSREELLRKVWGYDYLGETRTVDVHVRRLRMKLAEGRLIETVTGVGYKLVPQPVAAPAA